MRPYPSGSEYGVDLFGLADPGVEGSINRLGSFLRVSNDERDSSSSVLMSSTWGRFYESFSAVIYGKKLKMN
jgi:hypothetical protein